jgi:putative ABC transport system permease protein
MILSLTILISLPFCLNILVNQSESYLMNRAKDTPLIVGTKGSSLDLVINSLYFEKTEITDMDFDEVNRVKKTGFALPIPLHTKFNSKQFPIVGTTMEYFKFRGLEIVTGDLFTMLGECVLGAEVAKTLNLSPGQQITSSPETALDITGVYPLKMNITGVLKKSFSPDDKAIFTDIKTTWVIEGLIHGHQDVETSDDTSVLLGVKDNIFIANAKLYNYNTITPENISNFHIHGDTYNHPISSLISVPFNKKDKALLMGRYLSKDEKSQILIPRSVIKKLLDNIFKFKKFFEGMFVFVAIALIMLFSLVITLSLRLRNKEIQTMFKLGSSRFKIFEIISFELIILILFSVTISSGLIYFALINVDNFIKLLVF